MSVINPFVLEAVRRQWPVLGALVVLVGITVSQALVFSPMARRYDAAIKSAGALGLAPDPDQMPETIPPRLFALIADNALPPATAQERASSGALTASLIEDVNRLATRRGMDLVLTEPGTVTQQLTSVQAHAHLRIRCRFRDFTGLLDDIARSGTLMAVDRFTLEPIDGGRITLELWVSRCVLKQTGVAH